MTVFCFAFVDFAEEKNEGQDILSFIFFFGKINKGETKNCHNQRKFKNHIDTPCESC